MHDITSLNCSRIAQDLQIRKVQVEAVVGLLDEGNTVPFITRYRKERTGGLNEDLIRQVQTRIGFLRHLAERKQTILKSIEGQGKLTEELSQAILKADTTKRLEDLYIPFKPKKRSQASKAREQGLGPLAWAIWYSDPAVTNLEEMLQALVNPEKELKVPEDVRTGVQNILAEMMAETAVIRAGVRTVLWETGRICSAKSDKMPDGMEKDYKDYFEFSESARQIPPHRILALNRGEKEHALKIRMEWNAEAVKDTALKCLSEQLLHDVGQMPPIEPPAASPAPSPEAATPAAESAPAAYGYVTVAGVENLPPLPTVENAPAPVAGTPVQETGGLTPRRSPEEIVMQGESLAGGEFKSPHTPFLRQVLDDALNRLLLPSLEREIRRELSDEAEAHAVAVFARNLRSLLLQPPLRGKRVLAIDPGFRTGCKVAALDEYGNLLEHGVIYPHTSHGRKGKVKESPPAPSADQTTVADPAAGEVAAAPTGALGPVATPEQPAPPPVIAEEVIASPETPRPAEATPEPAPALEAAVAQPNEPPSAPSTEAAVTASPPESSTPTIDKRAEAKAKLVEMISKFNLEVVALGNGTGCRETEELVAELIGSTNPNLSYVVVNEAGASVYSVSPVGREEFPDFDATLRGTISIGRRLQDPLSELVKVDPQNIGVGLYQHDMGRKELKESLDAVVESCVNQVGVDLNTASVPLLRHVSGLNQLVARELCDYRKEHGAFTTREALLQVAGLGPARYVQAAGFLKIPGGPNPLDRTWIHPESYPIATQVLTDLGYSPNVLEDKGAQEEFQTKLKTVNVEEAAKKLNVGLPTIADILEALARPGLDPREELPAPIFKKGILKLEDLQPGMELKGTVLNVVDFGAFVDIGLKDSGLVHISQLANRYIKSPYEVVAVSDVVKVWVLTVDKERHRVSLTMIEPGTERKPGEKGQARPPREGRPPRGRRPQGPPVQGEGQAQQGPPGQGRPSRGRGPRRGPGGPPPRTPAPGTPQPISIGQGQADGSAPQTTGAAVGRDARSNEPAPRPVPPPRKPRREPPRPKLSQAALEGKVPLRTFSELSALFAAKKEPERKEVPAEQPAAPQAVQEKPPLAAEPIPTTDAQPPGEQST